MGADTPDDMFNIAFYALFSSRVKTNSTKNSAFRELEPAPGTGLTGFLTFLDPGIARHHAVGLERRPEFLVELHQRPGHAVAQSAGLTGHAAAVDVGGHIILAGAVHHVKHLDYFLGEENQLLVQFGSGWECTQIITVQIQIAVVLLDQLVDLTNIGATFFTLSLKIFQKLLEHGHHFSNHNVGTDNDIFELRLGTQRELHKTIK